MRFLERLFERALWSSRLVVLVAVIFGVLLALGAFYLATVEVFYALGYLVQYADPALGAEERQGLRVDAVSAIVKAVDEYLIGAILIIFALGLYELFVSKLEAAERAEAAPRLLLIRNLDQLKERIASLIMLVLAIEFFQRALQLSYENALDLLFFAAGVLLVSGALYLSISRHSREETEGRVSEG
ncbi:MAG: YqhA family protein [Actinomycetota bacterium]|nr:YqhA family protein [Actinomycetota bacterium]